MIRNDIANNDSPVAAALTPDLLASMKKEDMKQAIVERFSYRAKAVAPQAAAQPKVRSPYWQPVDEEC